MNLVNINEKAQKEKRVVGLECKAETEVYERYLFCGSEIVVIIFACVMIIYFINVYRMSNILSNALYIPVYSFEPQEIDITMVLLFGISEILRWLLTNISWLTCNKQNQKVSPGMFDCTTYS